MTKKTLPLEVGKGVPGMVTASIQPASAPSEFMGYFAQVTFLHCVEFGAQKQNWFKHNS